MEAIEEAQLRESINTTNHRNLLAAKLNQEIDARVCSLLHLHQLPTNFLHTWQKVTEQPWEHCCAAFYDHAPC